MRIHLPRRWCADVHRALSQEWLVTNGLGGFAAGTVAGALTRRYHGLMMAALDPPVDRTLLVAKLDDTVRGNGRDFPLYTNAWPTGVEEPNGCAHLQYFDLIDGVPVWTFECGGAQLTKRIWMEPGRNVTYVHYELDPAADAVQLECRLLVNDRPYHLLGPEDDRDFDTHATGDTLITRAADATAETRVRCVGGGRESPRWRVESTWCHDFELGIEAERGFEHRESHLIAGVCRVALEPETPITFVIGAEDSGDIDVGEALKRRTALAQARLKSGVRLRGCVTTHTPTSLQQLLLAANQFLVARPGQERTDGSTIIAGYPWFTDWGRDTMIALPGLTLVTDQPDAARRILLTWAGLVEGGLIPNRFPDDGGEPEYHAADAALWYLWAIDQYVRVTGDVQTLAKLYPVMTDIIAAYRHGTRHNIHVGDDGLVYAGEEGLNLTWMDAKVGDRVVTPRTGKPVEINALWYDALCNLVRLAELLDRPNEEYVRLAQRAQGSFHRFWNAERNCCFDVIDGPGGNDGRIRPNQIFAASLSHSPLYREQREALVETCHRRLLTWFGLRSLAHGEHDYHGRYEGNPAERDEAYHQGTVWSWLLGPFVIADYRIHHDAARARHLLEPLCGQLWRHGLGSLSEIFDGDEPHRPNGCVAQAWTVAELLRAWQVTQVHAMRGA